VGGSNLDEPPVSHHCDPVAQAHRLVEVVGDEDDGLSQSLLQVDQLLLHVAADQRVESGEGLIHQQYVGICRQGPGQPHALTHATGELGGQLVAPAVQAHHLQRTVGTLHPLTLGNPLDLQRVGGVVQHCAVRQQCEVLEHHGDPSAADLPHPCRRNLAQVILTEVDVPAVGPPDTVEHTDERGLAGPGEAHDHEDLTLLHLEGGVDDRRSTQVGDIAAAGPLGQLRHSFGRATAENLVYVLNT